MLFQAHIREPHMLIKHRQLCSKIVKSKVSFVHAIYHISKHFRACVGACVCDCRPLLKGPAYIYFRLVLLQSVSYYFFLYQSPYSLSMVFDSISSNIDEVLSISPSADVFVFGDFNIHHKDWLTFQMELIDLENSVLLLRWLTFLPGSQTVILLALLIWIYFF